MNKAVRENTVYHGYRWLLVDRDLDPNVIHDIFPTKKVRPQVVGYIAQLNGDKTKILNVYIDRKTAAHCNGYESSGLDIPVKKSIVNKNFTGKQYCMDNGIELYYHKREHKYNSSEIRNRTYELELAKRNEQSNNNPN